MSPDRFGYQKAVGLWVLGPRDINPSDSRDAALSSANEAYYGKED
jgi:hypothetical protein